MTILEKAEEIWDGMTQGERIEAISAITMTEKSKLNLSQIDVNFQNLNHNFKRDFVLSINIHGELSVEKLSIN